ncbi:MAG: hypothetical protein AAFN10_23170 [Bacteroidota bacterium]
MTLRQGANLFPLRELLGPSNTIGLENPEGNAICVEVISLKYRELLAQSCESMPEVASFPPHLVYPFDGEEVRTLLPVFSWTPPGPLIPGQQVAYRIRIVEVLPYQTPEVAIQSGLAFFERKGLTQNLLPWALSDRQFETKKRYAWQIKAYDNERFMGRSEVWSFVFESPAEGEDEKPDYDYVALNIDHNGGFYPARGYVGFRFDHPYAELQPRIVIRDVEGNKRSLKADRLEHIGRNLYVAHLPPGSGFREGDIYYLEVHNQKGKMGEVRFQYLYAIKK